MLTALIIDDEAPSREELRALLANAPDVEILGECANAIEGLAAIHHLKPDAVFLDIQMPRVSGLEMVGMIDPAALPRIVFVTAYDEHALQAFEEHAADYLLKPIDPSRLKKTLDWLRSGSRLPRQRIPGAADRLQRIPCCGRQRIVFIPVGEVEYVYTDIAGVHVIGTDKHGMTELALKTLQEKSPLIRCHRQYLVNPDHIREIVLQENGAAEIVTPSGKRIPVSRRHFRELKDRLQIS
jgi:two-component system LytT family response regulator